MNHLNHLNDPLENYSIGTEGGERVDTKTSTENLLEDTDGCGSPLLLLTCALLMSK